MPTPTKGARFGGSPAHERMILSNLATQLFEHGRIRTTEAKAKRLRPLAEKLITKAKRGDLHARRQVLTTVRDKGVVHVLFTEIAPTFADREGGYTRITKIGPRKGDNAPMALIELVTETVEDSKAANSGTAGSGSGATAKKSAARPAKKSAPAPAEVQSSETEASEAQTADAQEETAIDTDAAAAEATTVVEDTDSEASDESAPVDGTYRGAKPPAGFTIKGNEDSMKFHTTESQWYAATEAEVWFDTEEAAQAAGFTKAG